MSKPLKIITAEDQMRRINEKINPRAPDEEIVRMQRDFARADIGYAIIEKMFETRNADNPFKGITRSGHDSFPRDFGPTPYSHINFSEPDPVPPPKATWDRDRMREDLRYFTIRFMSMPPMPRYEPIPWDSPTPFEDNMKYPKPTPPKAALPAPKPLEDGIVTCPKCRRLRHTADPHDCEVKKKR